MIKLFFIALLLTGLAQAQQISVPFNTPLLVNTNSGVDSLDIDNDGTFDIYIAGTPLAIMVTVNGLAPSYPVGTPFNMAGSQRLWNSCYATHDVNNYFPPIVATSSTYDVSTQTNLWVNIMDLGLGDFRLPFKLISGKAGYLYVSANSSNISILGYEYNNTPNGVCTCLSTPPALGVPDPTGINSNGDFKYYNLMGYSLENLDGLTLQVSPSGTSNLVWDIAK